MPSLISESVMVFLLCSGRGAGLSTQIPHMTDSHHYSSDTPLPLALRACLQAVCLSWTGAYQTPHWSRSSSRLPGRRGLWSPTQQRTEKCMADMNRQILGDSHLHYPCAVCSLYISFTDSWLGRQQVSCSCLMYHRRHRGGIFCCLGQRCMGREVT